ncbi:PilZ domain-containing protein [Rhizobium sp. C1]|uniref:PilZ domain-containing protein n=1 Tax=Rhizobium sp. C1 TaxID=1349799 RepID=UPI001E5C7487|nr:PilZ domain-containing protein [Rhizobium sp. C1]MCD2177536.1 PilZ domain-containing protein [Rhizobium sp. C1]
MDKVNYMSEVRSDLYERAFETHKVRQNARIITIGRGLTGLSERQAKVVDISIAGAGLELLHCIGLPKHYYLMIEGFPNRIGCAEIYRNDRKVGVKFIAPIDEHLIHKMIRADYFRGK